MNWFGVACSVMQAVAAVEALWDGDRRMALVWAAYSVAGAVLAWKN